MKTSIIIPFFNKWNLTHARMMELYKHAPTDVEIVLVDDASTDEDCAGGVAWWQKRVNKHTIRYYKNETNLGFGGSMNKGAKIAIKNGADAIVLLSNDVVISGDFVTEIVTILNQDNSVFIGGQLLDIDTGWNKIGNRVFPYLNGWLLACSSETWLDIGGFDERYKPYDFEDVDISTTAIQKGHKLVELKNQCFRHIGGQTAGYNEARVNITKANREKFIEKWKNVE